MSRAWIALGANLGDRARVIAGALGSMDRVGLRVERASRLYETRPVVDSPGGGGLDPAGSPWFLNAVAEVTTDLPPAAVLGALLGIERAAGRDAAVRSGDRVLDLDLLAYDDRVAEASAPGEPILPHPRLRRRAFVLVPLCELDPLWRHPGTGETAAELLAGLPISFGDVRRFQPGTERAEPALGQPR